MRGWRRSAALVAAVVLVAPGCWLQSGYDARRTGANTGEATVTAGNVDTVQVAWEVPGARKAVVSGGTAYLAGDADVRAVRLATGAQRWSVPARPSDVAVAGDRLWVAAGDVGCSLQALEAGTGAALTTHSFGGNAFNLGAAGRSFCTVTDMLVRGGTVSTTWTYVAYAQVRGSCFPGFTSQTGSGTVTLDAATGELVTETGGVGIPGCTGSTPAPVSTLSSDGAVTYMPTDTTITRFGTCGASPCAPLPLPAGVTAVAPVVPAPGGNLVLTSTDGRAFVLDAATGAVRWSGTFASATSAPPTVTADAVLVTGVGGVVASFPLAGCGAATCDPSWVGAAEGDVVGRPTVGGDVAYVADAAGGVRAYAAGGCGAATCAPIADLAGGPSTASPVVANGTVLAPSTDALVAHRLP